MRLIDADKLVMHLADFALSMSGKSEYSTIQQCIKAVEEQPTVDTSKEIFVHVNVDTDDVLERLKELGWKPVKHGRWIDKYGDGDWHCTRCGAIVEKHEQDYRNWYFCYHCGARMDGDKNG